MVHETVKELSVFWVSSRNQSVRFQQWSYQHHCRPTSPRAHVGTARALLCGPGGRLSGVGGGWRGRAERQDVRSYLRVFTPAYWTYWRHILSSICLFIYPFTYLLFYLPTTLIVLLTYQFNYIYCSTYLSFTLPIYPLMYLFYFPNYRPT